MKNIANDGPSRFFFDSLLSEIDFEDLFTGGIMQVIEHQIEEFMGVKTS